jgi:hypothetical protein
MRRLIKRWLLRHKLVTLASHLEGIRRERAMLEHAERHYLKESTALHAELLNLDIRRRRA